MGKVLETNCTTGEKIERDETAEEIAIREQAHQELMAREAERQAATEALATLKNSARAKLVAGEPLTEEEAATVVL